MAKPKPRCPRCNRRKSVVQRLDGDYLCTHCSAMFDNDPDEGGDYSERNPAARLERQERKRRR